MKFGNDVRARAGCSDRSVVQASAIRQRSVASGAWITKLMNESDIPLRCAFSAKRRSSRPSGRLSVVREAGGDVGGEGDHFPFRCESELASMEERRGGDGRAGVVRPERLKEEAGRVV